MTRHFEPEHALVGAPEHTRLRVEHILFDQMRARCAQNGLFEGCELRSLGATAEYVLIDVLGRGPITIDLALAAFIEVAPVA